MANGALRGITGDERRSLFVYWLSALVISGSFCLFVVLTRRHDTPQQNPLDPLIDEGSSWLMMALALALPAAVVMWARLASPPRWVVAMAHAACLIIYSLIHVSGFVLLRKIAFPLLIHEPYRFGPFMDEFLYELGKDAVAYVMAAAGCWLILQWRLPQAQEGAAPADPPSFDIRDGARLIRAPVGEILAVRSAGNYAEFLLADGRRPLMRSSLGAIQASLTPRGFVRTHRSWLVNRDRITGLRPVGSGDYTIELGALEAPLSRRFRDALAQLGL